MKKIQRKFYNQKTIAVAKALLGKLLVHKFYGKERIGRIVEVEAYLGPHDLASHSSKGLTQRTEIMFGPPGYAYIYLIYGMYYCLNIVTEKKGHASAVLIRALQPVKNIETSTKGPGLLCKAMHIDKRLHGCDLLGDKLYIADDFELDDPTIVSKPRIGVDYAEKWAKKRLRFYIKDNHFISRK